MNSSLVLRTLPLALALALSLSACGGASAFGDTFPDNHGEHVALVLSRLETARAGASAARRESAIAITVTAAPSRLQAYDLRAGAQLWESAVTLRSVPQLAGRSVVTHEESEIVVRDLATGRVTARIADRSLNLAGAAGEGHDGVIVLSTGGGVGAFSVIQGLHDGSPTFSAQMGQAFGAPAVSAGMAFIPWGHQNLSVVDLGSGGEIARIRPSEGVVASATAIDGNVFFGQSGVALLGTETSPSFATLQAQMPANPQLLRDAYQPPQGPNSAQNRVRLAYRPVAEAGHAAFADGSVYLVFYRLVFALAADGRTARWVAQIPRDVIGANVVDGGVLVIDESGAAHLLATADGRETWSAQLGAGLVFAAAAADGLTGGAPRGDAMPLRDQLLSAAQNTDGRLVPLRELAVRLLAAMPEEGVTENVIAICDDRSITASVRNAACEALATRTQGADHVLAALDRHAAFLRGVRSPPVGALARAAVGMGERRAVPRLAGHLRDPETAAADIAPLAAALATFGDPSALEPLADFIRLYHAESPDAGLEAGMTACLEAYRQLAGPTSRELLEEVANDGLALEPIRNAARAQLAALDAPTQVTGEQTTASEVQGSGPDMTITEADDPRPAQLTVSMVEAILEPSRPELERCLITPARVFQHARVVIVVDPQGGVLMVTSNPPAVNACIEPIVRGASYPATRARGRQQVTIEVRR
ncbi:MAG: hypothetical protein K1X94_20670 [Sandaracinaceae bacterium]|nr:hypothetical protein [Sandaracinaceae bacterium]